MAKVSFGDRWGIEYTVPELQRYAHISRNESIIIFDAPSKDSKARLCLGVGRVLKVQKGKELDLVYINFGRSYSRRIIVVDNQARRQVYTLKQGQLVTFYGYYNVYLEEGKPKAVFHAKGFQAWFVPKAMDIKGYDTEKLEELEKENETTLINFLDEITKENDK